MSNLNREDIGEDRTRRNLSQGFSDLILQNLNQENNKYLVPNKRFREMRKSF
uniref:Uncharacterized protein n=1 Tax=viral metagenome TaxID=1070528 RepID=A0A6C0KH62_9ZZZZ